VDDDIKELVLSLHAEGLLEAAPQEQTIQHKTQRPFLRKTLFSLLFLLTAGFGYVLSIQLSVSEKSRSTFPYIRQCETAQTDLSCYMLSTQQRRLWSSNDLSPGFFPTHEHSVVVDTLEKRRSCLSEISQQISNLMSALTKEYDPDLYKALEAKIIQAYQADHLFNQTLSLQIERCPKEKQEQINQTLHLLGAHRNLAQYKATATHAENLQKTLSQLLSRVDQASDLEQLSEAVFATVQLIQTVQQDNPLFSPIDLVSARQALLNCSSKALLSMNNTQPLSTEQNHALVTVQTLLPSIDPSLVASFALSPHATRHMLDHNNQLIGATVAKKQPVEVSTESLL